MMPTLAEVLAAELAAKGWSVYRLSQESGLAVSGCQRIIDGGAPNPGVLTVLRLLRPLGRDLAWLHRKGIR